MSSLKISHCSEQLCAWTPREPQLRNCPLVNCKHPNISKSVWRPQSPVVYSPVHTLLPWLQLPWCHRYPGHRGNACYGYRNAHTSMPRWAHTHTSPHYTSASQLACAFHCGFHWHGQDRNSSSPPGGHWWNCSQQSAVITLARQSLKLTAPIC